MALYNIKANKLSFTFVTSNKVKLILKSELLFCVAEWMFDPQDLSKAFLLIFVGGLFSLNAELCL